VDPSARATVSVKRRPTGLNHTIRLQLRVGSLLTGWINCGLGSSRVDAVPAVPALPTPREELLEHPKTDAVKCFRAPEIRDRSPLLSRTLSLGCRKPAAVAGVQLAQGRVGREPRDRMLTVVGDSGLNSRRYQSSAILSAVGRWSLPVDFWRSLPSRYVRAW
jgi:hypothetical protein